MKKLVITFITFLSILNFIQCQTANIITLTEFNNIEINGHKFIDIKNTQGEQNTMETLFGRAIDVDIDSYGEYSHYEYDGFSIGFSSFISGSENEWEIGAFEITKNNFNITIQGVTVTVGDSINLLGDVVFNTMRNGNQSIVYQYCDGCNSFISIRFNQLTNIITEIIFIEQT